MLNSNVLDVAIGLVFIYLLLGLLVSVIQEAIAGFLKLRGNALRDHLLDLLRTGQTQDAATTSLFTKVYEHGLVAGANESQRPSYVSGANFALALVEALRDGSKAPIFTQVERTVATLPDSSTSRVLKSLLDHAGGDLDAFRQSLAGWFDTSMDRLSGSYKRQSQVWALGLGLFVAVGLNVDTIRVASVLWTSQSARQLVVQSAEGWMKTHDGPSIGPGTAAGKPTGDARSGTAEPPASHATTPPAATPPATTPPATTPPATTPPATTPSAATPPPSTPPATTPPAETPPATAQPADPSPATATAQSGAGISSPPVRTFEEQKRDMEQVLATLEQLPLPIGWRRQATDESVKSDGARGNVAKAGEVQPAVENFGPLTLVGWLITAFAVSLGAPFWFDTLQRILNLRNSGPKPPSSGTPGAGT